MLILSRGYNINTLQRTNKHNLIFVGIEDAAVGKGEGGGNPR